jgi:uncharacterized OB-fold protein
VRGSDGRVHVPPVEYDPVTARPLTELVEVSTEGTVLTWSWQAKPLAGQPLPDPFGWALIRVDGADTAMLHAVDAGTPDRMRTGMRVRVRWSASRATDPGHRLLRADRDAAAAAPPAGPADRSP